MKHLFICGSVPASAAWLEAFPDGCYGQPADSLAHAESFDMVWLLLSGAGLEVLRSQRLAGCRVVAMSTEPNDDEGLDALNQGAVAYCNASAAPDVLRQVAEVVSQGGLWVGSSLLNRLLRQATLQQPRPRINWDQALTAREAEIARAAANGWSNKEIAARLGITERTVKAHLTVVFEKLQLRDRLQLSLHIHGLN